MKPPDAKTIHAMRADSAYEYLGSQSYNIWPGYAERHVFRFKENGLLWAKDIYMGDDTSEEGRWYRVREVVTTRYEP